MKAFVPLLAVLLALPASAQLVPDEFPDASESMADRARRDLVERHRGFLSGLYAESGIAIGPQAGAPSVLAGGSLEGGYRFRSGDGIALLSSYRAPLQGTPLGDEATAGVALLGAQAIVSLGRVAPGSELARRAEVAVGMTALFDDDATIPTVELSPRVAFPLTPVLSLPVGLRISHELGDATPRGTFVGLSIGLRRIWADEARMVLE